MPLAPPKVQLYQINCSGDSAGESAIILVLQKAAGPKGKVGILSAVLVDAGLGVSAVEMILETIDAIESDYPTCKPFKFDAVVISHWDRDHWYGLGKSDEIGILNDTTRGWSTMTEQIQCFKYDSNDDPETRFYAPTAPTTSRKLKFDTDSAGENGLKFIPDLTKPKDQFFIAKAFESPDLMGVEVFFGGVPKTLPIDTPSDLLTSSPVYKSGYPGLYIVGADGMIVDNSNLKVVDQAKATDTNKSSILLLLAWQKKSGEPAFSFYSGGDAEWEVENDLAEWLNAGTVASNPVTMIKGGHHGSRAGTSITLVKATNPRHYIVSPARQYGHPVPEIVWYFDSWFSWQSNLSVDKTLHSVCFPYWLGVTQPNPKDDDDLRWINTKFIDPDSFSPAGKRDTDYQEYFDNLLYDPKIKKKKQDPLSQFATAVAGMSPPQQKAWLANKLFEMWDAWSDTHYTSYPVKKGDPGELYKPNNWIKFPLKYIFAEISFNKTKDTDVVTVSSRLATIKTISGPDADNSRQLKKFKTTQPTLGAEQASTLLTAVTSPRPASIKPPAKFKSIRLSQREEFNIICSELTGDLNPSEQDDQVEVTEVVISPPSQPQTPTSIAAIYPLDADSGSYQPLEAPEILFIGPPSDPPAPPQNTYNFLYSLHNSSLTLTTPSIPQSGLWQGTLAVDDDWQLWIQNFLDLSDQDQLDTTTSVLVSGDLSNISPLTAFRVITNIGPWKLVYASDRNVLISSLIKENNKDDVTAAVTSTLDEQGIYNPSLTLMLTADSKPTGSIQLAQLFQLANLDFPAILSSHSTAPFSWDGDQKIQALWFSPVPNYRTTLKLQVKDDTDVLAGSLPGNPLGGLTRSSSSVIVTRTCSYRTMNVPNENADTWLVSSGSFAVEMQINFGDPEVDPYWDVYFSISSNEILFIIQYNGEDNLSATDGRRTNPTGIVGWLFDKVAAPEVGRQAYRDIVNAMNGNFSSNKYLLMRQASLGFTYVEDEDEDGDGGEWVVSSFTIDWEIDVPWGLDEGKKAVPLLITFAYTTSIDSDHGDTSTDFRIEVKAQIWPYMSTQTLLEESLSETAQPFRQQIPLFDSETVQYYFDLGSLPHVDFDQVNRLPQSFPRKLVNTSLDIVYDTSTGCTVAIAAELLIDDDSNALAVQSMNFPQVVLVDISLRAKLNFPIQGPANLDFFVAAFVNLNPRDGTSGIYTSVRLSADVEYQRQGDNSVWNLHGTAENFSLAAIYSLFSSNDGGRAMDLLEQIYIPFFEIRYIYDSSGVGTSFSADGTIMLGPVELDLAFQNSASDDPSKQSWSFVATLSDNRPSGSNFGDFLSGIWSDILNDVGFPDFLKKMGFSIRDTTSQDAITLTVKKLDDTFMILAVTAFVGDFEFVFVQITDGTNVKRLLKFGVDKLPEIEVPLIQQFEQPFDEMDFMWVSQNGLTVAEITKINAAVFSDNQHPLVYKKPNPETPTTVAISGGVHFCVVLQERNTPTCVIDYPFTSPATNQQLEAAAAAAPNPTATGSLVKTTGPLSLQSLSLKESEGYLSIGFDAFVNLDAFKFSLQGFSVSFPLTKIQAFELADVSVAVKGIGIELGVPPVAIAGSLDHIGDLYSGGVGIALDPYSIIAAGEYGIPPTESFDTLFAFIQSKGPLLELEFGSLDAVTGGFGHNTSLTIPSVSNVTSFPFLDPTVKGGDVLGILHDFLQPSTGTPWIKNSAGSFWLAFGLTGKIVQVLDIDMVTTLDIGSDVIIGLFADCIASVPDSNPSTKDVFARAEMGIAATLDIGKGVVQIEGQMTPRSFVLDPNCHLTGGFAFCYWFGNLGHDGDFVLTIGGYHSAFKKPSWYPDVPRVGISWHLDSNISITGDAYFAITPKACMGGGGLNLTFSLDDISAYYNAYADFLVNYKPFWFVADVAVTVGAAYKLKIGRLVKRFHIDYGAAVHLEGPPFSGYVKIKWIIISFEIKFGPSSSVTPALGWKDFINQLTGKTDGSTTTMHKLTAVQGVLDQSDEWTVDSTTVTFMLSVLFPLTKISFNSNNLAVNAPSVYVKPMQQTESFTSSLKATIQSVPSDGSAAEACQFIPSIGINQVPLALWGQYNKGADPGFGGTGDLLSTTQITTPQPMSLTFSTPEPDESADALNVDVREACFENVMGQNADPMLHKDAQIDPAIKTSDGRSQVSDFETAQSSWAAATPSNWNTVKGAMNAPSLNFSNLLDSWEKYSGALKGDPLMDEMENVLRKDVSQCPNWASKNTGYGYTLQVYAVPPAMSRKIYV